MKREETIDFNIKAAWHGIYRMYNQEAAKHDSTAAMGFVLLNIDIENGTPATKIAPLMGMESRSITRLLKALEEQGYIHKEKDQSDGRSVRICLTDAGKEKREIARQTVRAFNKAIKSKVSEAQLSSFFKVVNVIFSTIEDKTLFENISSNSIPKLKLVDETNHK